MSVVLGRFAHRSQRAPRRSAAPDGAAPDGTALDGTALDGTAQDDAAAPEVLRSADEEFAAFVAANYARLLHVAELVLGDRGKAEDALQTVLTRTYLRWRKVRQANPLGYVRKSLVNTHIDWWRRGMFREQATEALPDDRAEPDHAGRVVGRDAVLRALAALTKRERAVVVLRFYEDLSEAEIARTLGVAPGTVKSTCARALAKLRISPELTPATEPADSIDAEQGKADDNANR